MTIKKLSLLAAAFAFAFITAGSASAEWDVNDGSTLDFFRSRVTSIKVSNQNEANIDNKVVSSASSGGNVIAAQEDVEDAEITTGDADVNVEIENAANDIDSEVDVDLSGCGCDFEEDIIVDDDSDVTVKDESEDELEVYNDNKVEADNEVFTHSKTGYNVIASEDDDVEGGTIDTGTASTSSSIINAFNILRSRISWNN